MSSLPIYVQYKDVVPPNVVPALSTVTDDQKKKIQELRQIVDSWKLDKLEQDFCDDTTLWRFLHGLHFDLQVTAGQLKETCEWRAKFKPHQLLYKDIEPAAKQGYLFHYGYDKKYRPIIYLILGKDKVENNEEGQLLKFKSVAHLMERIIRKTPKGVHNFTWIIDTKDTSLSLGVVKQMKDMFSKLGDYYTERLAMAFVVNVHWTLKLVWNCVCLFLQPETVAKYQLVQGTPEQLREPFTKHIDADQLLVEYGGNAKFTFDFAEQSKLEELELAAHHSS